LNELAWKTLMTIDTNHHGFIFPQRSIRKGFLSACKRAGIQNFRIHDARHTFASRLIEKGASIVTLRELLGHSSLEMSLRYSHSDEKQKEDAVNRLKLCYLTKADLDKGWLGSKDSNLDHMIQSHEHGLTSSFLIN